MAENTPGQEPQKYFKRTKSQWQQIVKSRKAAHGGRDERLGFEKGARHMQLQTLKSLEEAEEKRLRDNLTGLLNREGFTKVLEQQLAQSKKTGIPLSILYIDMDKFKDINDELGHTKGDEIIKATADVLTHSIRPTDNVGRIYGDEFAVLVTNAATQEIPRVIAERIKNNTERQLPEKMKAYESQREEPITLSIGISIAGDNLQEMTAERLMEQADTALYHSKQERNTITLYQAGMTMPAKNGNGFTAK